MNSGNWLAALAAICATLSAVTHGWILLGHRNQLKPESSDEHRDPLVNRLTMRLGLSLLVGWIFAFWITSPQIRVYLVSSVTLFQDPRMTKIINLPWTVGFLKPSFESVSIGTLIFAFGVFLRLLAIRTLGRFFTFEVGIRQDHEVIRIGPYRYLRHPSYTGYLLMAIGQGIIFQSLGISLFLFSIAIAFLGYRISYEEKVLSQHFGIKYSDYQKETWRLIPWLY